MALSDTQNARHGNLREVILFAMLGTLMFCSKIMMEFLPNVHLLGVLTMVYTLVYEKKALIPIYIYIILNGMYAGFSVWWIPYLYIWTILWGVTMLLPHNMKEKTAMFVYPIVCAAHGLFFGTLYAPAQAIMMKMSFSQTVAWVVAGLPWDAVHMVGNYAVGLLILPLVKVLRKLNKQP